MAAREDLIRAEAGPLNSLAGHRFLEIVSAACVSTLVNDIRFPLPDETSEWLEEIVLTEA